MVRSRVRDMRRLAVVTAATLTLGLAVWPGALLSHERVTTTVTYDREIVRIVHNKCIACHSERNLGVPLTTYEETRPWARAIQEEVLSRHMPPWRAVPGYGHFANDVGLTNRERLLLIAWIEGSGPKTKAQSLIVNLDQGQTPEDERLTAELDRWQLGEPDVSKALPVHTLAPGQGDSIRRVRIDLALTADTWIRALEFRPGDRRVVRAAFFSVEETGQWLGSWTPWHGVTTLPDNTAYHVPAGSHVIAEIHDRSLYEPAEDQSRLGLYLAAGPPTNSPIDLVVKLKEEKLERTRKFVGSLRLPSNLSLLAFRPEVQGVESVEVIARKPDGATDVLLLVRDVLPEWPTPYILEKPVGLPKDTELRVTYYASAAAQQPPAADLTFTASALGR
jgi:hypothetical protein